MIKHILCGLALAAVLAAQTSVPTTGAAIIPAGTFEPPFSVVPPLQKSGGVVSCPTCGGSGGGGGTVSNLFPWQPGAWIQPSPLSGWTQVNGGGNGTFSDVRGGVLINTGGGQNQKYLYQVAPGVPFTATAHFSSQCPSNSYSNFGILIGDSGAKTTQWKLAYQNTQGGQAGDLTLEHWDTATGPATNPYLNLNAGVSGDTWLRVKYDGSTFLYSASPTGTDDAAFYQFTGEPAGTYLASAPAKIGFVASSQASWAGACLAILNYWSVTQP